MKKTRRKEPRTRKGAVAAMRSRESQSKLHDMVAGGVPPHGTVTQAIEQATRTDALHDSGEPPLPQLRRARSTFESGKMAQDKNTGIKHRDASGQKHRAAPQR